MKLRREGKVARCIDVIQRLLAKDVAGEQKGTRAAVVQTKCEHGIEPRKGADAPLFDGGQQDFSIALGLKFDPDMLQLDFELAEIVEFAVVGDRSATSAANHRLATAR